MAFSQFDRVPNHYAGSLIQRIKDFRLEEGKRSLAPTRLPIGGLEILIPRHFGFCFGVERAIHMAFAALDEHPDRHIHLISEIIHNPLVNRDLQERGIRFLFDEHGQRQIGEGQIGEGDVVLIPAFGTTLEIEESLQRSGIDPGDPHFRKYYDTTCPFVSKVWDRGEQLGREGYTIIIHGKFGHEETQATHSHTRQHTRTLVVRDREEAQALAAFILGEVGPEEFAGRFAEKWSPGFDLRRDLKRVAVVNQTTMLAEETQEVASILREAMRRRYGEQRLEHHFADTNDTLCYATNWNQNATKALLAAKPDLAVVVGGYNSSNTSHLVEICSQQMPSFLIENSGELLSPQRLAHFDIHHKERVFSEGWLPAGLPARIAVTSGASCPDVLMNQVVEKLAGFYGYGQAEISAGLERLSLVDQVVSGKVPS
ncbi:MAG: 4-hydroxy-3-methylbut-2-enyl diphosphate reductase [Candidatus Handelsmanbacteria bacterium]|nr:4-hydroxy-3-methylbut-2-enyl diphosphate reductase [Candidatus Handelsmanbacteria bacterium]